MKTTQSHRNAQRVFAFLSGIAAATLLIWISGLSGPVAQATPSDNPVEVANALSHAFAQVAEGVLPSVVSITSERVVTLNGQAGGLQSLFPDFFGFRQPRRGMGEPREYRQQGLGSGVIVRSDGIILTANHVVHEATDIRVLLTDDREYEAEVVGVDPPTDLAVLRIKADESLPATPIASDDDCRVGDWVLALGNPFGRNLRGTVTAGIVSAKGRSDIGLASYENFIQTDAAINPGNSGGPLVNLEGELIGINTAIASRSGGYQGVGFAIPADMARMVMDNILDKGRVERGWLGVVIATVDRRTRIAFGMDPDETGGVLIQEVQADSPADRGGMHDGDVILEMDGEPVADNQDLRFRVAATPPDEQVDFLILRDGDEKHLKFKVGEREEGATSQEQPDRADDPLDSLGFSATDLNDMLRGELNLDEEIEGVVVTAVEDYSPAHEGGLQRGDVITQVRIEGEKRDVRNVRQLEDMLGDLEPGTSFALYLRTQAGRRFVIITVPE